MKLRTLGLAALCLAAPLTAHADIAVSFIEGAPKDTFRIENTGACTITGGTLSLDLAKSAAGLIFDVTARGAGVEVFQPLEMVEGVHAIFSIPLVQDGDAQVAFDLVSLGAGETVSFTIDVDDTLGSRAITVSGSEIAGAQVHYADNGMSKTAVFGRDAIAILEVSGCMSS